MRHRPIVVFALSVLVAFPALAEDAAAAPKQAHASKRAAAGRADGSRRAAVHGLTPAQKLEQLGRPKDYSHDIQVQPAPEIVQGGVLLSESFDSGIPAGWAVVDNIGSGVVWTNLVGCGELGNFTSGAGEVACVSSDRFGPADYDTELLTPVLDLSTSTAPASLTFNVNYQEFTDETFEVDVSTAGTGGPWVNLLTWQENHGAFRATPGEAVNLDISSVAGQATVVFRFHYVMGTGGGKGTRGQGQAWDWYAQVDDVVVTATAGSGPPPSVVEVPTLSEIGLGGLVLLLAGAGLLVLRRQS